MTCTVSVEPLIAADVLRSRVRDLSREVQGHFGADEPYVVIGVLNGVFMFIADLLRHLEGPLEVDFIRARSYGDRTESQGEVLFEGLAKLDLRGKRVLVVDDIADWGSTLSQLLRVLEVCGALSVHTCSLIDKPSRRKVPFKVDFVGFTIEDHFIVGYGLDYAGRYRNLPAVHRLLIEA